MPRTGTWLLVALALAQASKATAATGDADLEVEVQVAWDGVARAERWTEFTIRVRSATGGEVAVEAEGSRVSTRVTGQLGAGAPETFRLPVFVESGIVPVRVTGPEGREVRTRVPLRMAGPARRVVAAPRPVSMVSEIDAATVEIDPATIPRLSSAFEVVDVVVLDAGTLSRLSLPQLTAIRRSVADCLGLVLLAEHRWPSDWIENAACGAESLRIAGREVLRDAVGEVLARRPRRLPEAPELSRQLAARRPHAGRTPLLTFFAAYTAVLVVAAVVARNGLVLAAIPVIAGLLLFGGLLVASPVASGVAWVETVAGSSSARLAALVRLDGLARREVELVVPASLGLPRPVIGRLRIEVDRGVGYRVVLGTQLLSRTSFSLRSAISWDAVFSLGMDGPGPRVRNRGSAVSVPAFFLWHGRAFALAPMAPGERVDPLAGDPVPLSRQAPAVAHARSAVREPAVIVADDRVSGLLEGVDWTGWTLTMAGELP